ncbi:MAG: hypothetical protein IKF36_04035 [Bacilli bacterium]|nr:hypothetical protein [Bacilli bacterium]
MNCKKCGYAITSLDQVCPNCGEPNEFFVNQQPVMPNSGVNAAPVEPVQPAPAVPPVAPVEPTPVAPVVPEAPVAPTPAPTATPVAPIEPTPVSIPSQNTMPNQGVNPSVGISQTQITPAKEKKNTGFILLVIFLVLVIAGLGTFIGIKLLSGNDSGSGGTANNGGGSGTNSGGGTQPVEVDTSTKLSVDGIDFTIPSGLTKKENNGVTTLVDSTNGYAIYISGVFDEDFNEVKQALIAEEAQFKTKVESTGGVYIGMNDYSSNGYNYFVGSYTINSVYDDRFITIILGNKLVTGELAYTSASKDLAYQTLSKLLNSAKADTSSSFVPTTKAKDDVISDIQVISSIE